MSTQAQPHPSAKVAKYKIKGSAKAIGFPGLPGVEYTEDHLNGEHGEMIVGVMKKKNAAVFAKLVEEVK